MGSLTSAGSAAAAPQHTDAQLGLQRRPHVVLLASPGAGHLIPLAELARRLVERHGFAVTLVTYTNFSDPRLLHSLPASVSTVALPAIQIDDQLTTNGPVGDMLRELVRRSLPDLRKLLRSIISTSPAPIAAFVPDFFCAGALPIAAELGVPGYLFFPGSLAWMALMRHIVELHDDLLPAPGECCYRDVAEPLELPGPLSLRRADLPESCRDCNGPSFPQNLEWGRRFRDADGLLVNTFSEMEPAAVEAFARGAFPPVFPVGPSIRSSSSDQVSDTSNSKSPCLEWLDRQPTGSVVYVSFGSGGALSVEQTVELAAGLEASGQRFLWIVRMPRQEGRHPFAFGHGHGDDDPLASLPEGFLERTEGRGLAVAAWAPQVRVLSHRATAAFVSHCGWNSTLESVRSGVPMVALPLCADQMMNAVMLEGNLAVALCPPPPRGGGVVGREEIAAAVNEIMEGEKGSAVKRRARDLQKAATDAWSPEGSSSRALEEVAAKWSAALGTDKQ